MLQIIRSKVTSIFVKILFVLLIVSFAIWGIGDVFFGSPAGKVAVEIGDEVRYTTQEVEFQINAVAHFAAMKICHGQSGRNQPYGQGVPLHFGDREGDPVNRDAALGDEVASTPFRPADPEIMVTPPRLEDLHEARTIDMARDKKAAQLAAPGGGALQIHGGARLQRREAGHAPRLLKHIKFEAFAIETRDREAAAIDRNAVAQRATHQRGPSPHA